jgi:hypothetical protein
MAWGQLGPSKLPAPFSAAGPGASGAGCPQRPGGARAHEQAAAATTGRAHCAHMAHMITMTLRAAPLGLGSGIRNVPVAGGASVPSVSPWEPAGAPPRHRASFKSGPGYLDTE